MLFIHPDFLLCSFCSHILLLNSFFSLCTRLLICHHAFSRYLRVEFSYIILEGSVLIVLLELVTVSVKSSFFHQYLLIYLYKLSCRICQQFYFGFSISTYHCVFFPLTLYLCLLSQFLYLSL